MYFLKAFIKQKKVKTNFRCQIEIKTAFNNIQNP